MRFDPSDKLVVAHAVTLQIAQRLGVHASRIDRGTHGTTVLRTGVATAVARVLVEEGRICRGVQAGIALQHLAVLILRTVRQDGVEIR